MGRTQRKRNQRRKFLQEVELSDTAFLPDLYKQMRVQGWQNTTDLAIRDFMYTGRGLCSKKHTFRIGGELIRLPANCLITIATLEEDASFKALFNEQKFAAAETKLNFQALMAIYVLQKKHLQQSTKLPAYFKSMPSKFSVPYFCALGELQFLPEAVLEKTVAQNRKIRQNFLTLKTIVSTTVCSCCGKNFFTDIYTLDEFRWAYFAVNTRSVYVDSRMLKPEESFFQELLCDDSNMALAPFLDLFNHTDQVTTSAELERNSVDNTFDFVIKLQGITPPYDMIEPYSQVFISYGVLSNFKLFIDYGFTLPNNLHDLFEFSLLDIEKFIKYEKYYSTVNIHRNKFKFIRDHNLHDHMFVHTRDGPSHNLHVVMHVIFKERTHHANTLNQIAFGAVDQLQSVQLEIRLLIAFKIYEYQRYVCQLQKFPNLTDSGAASIEYMLECIRYLDDYLEQNY